MLLSIIIYTQTGDLKASIESLADDIRSLSRDGGTLIHHSVENKDKPISKDLIERFDADDINNIPMKPDYGIKIIKEQ